MENESSSPQRTGPYKTTKRGGRWVRDRIRKARVRSDMKREAMRISARVYANMLADKCRAAMGNGRRNVSLNDLTEMNATMIAERYKATMGKDRRDMSVSDFAKIDAEMIAERYKIATGNDYMSMEDFAAMYVCMASEYSNVVRQDARRNNTQYRNYGIKKWYNKRRAGKQNKKQKENEKQLE